MLYNLTVFMCGSSDRACVASARVCMLIAARGYITIVIIYSTIVQCMQYYNIVHAVSPVIFSNGNNGSYDKFGKADFRFVAAIRQQQPLL